MKTAQAVSAATELAARAARAQSSAASDTPIVSEWPAETTATDTRPERPYQEEPRPDFAGTVGNLIITVIALIVCVWVMGILVTGTLSEIPSRENTVGRSDARQSGYELGCWLLANPDCDRAILPEQPEPSTVQEMPS